MTRLEVAVRSPLVFRHDPDPLPLRERLRLPPETVGIEYEGRLFVWHAFEPRDHPDFGHEEFGPTVSVVATDDADERAAADSLQRLLSALAFHYDQPADAISYGASPASDPFSPTTTRERRQFGWTLISEPPEAVVISDIRALRLALAYYREGRNASSAFYRFLAFWNVLDAVFEVENNAARRDAFIRAETRRLAWRWIGQPLPQDMPTHLERESRNAIAHVLRPQGRTHVDPDTAADRRRLAQEADWLRWVARAAVEAEFQNGVAVTRRHAA